jgi:nucleotide-binding universal stress UspA family protein
VHDTEVKEVDMRILLAIDGSAAAGRARDLVARLPWPAGSHIRVAAALEHSSDLVGLRGMIGGEGDSRDIETSTLRRLDDTLEASIAELSRSNVAVDRVILRGRPANAVVNEAKDFGADLVVMGNRGHSGMNAMLLGSVSAEVATHAPCPVLIARRERIGRVLFATDGSPAAEHAEHVLRDWPVFQGLPADVVSVAEVGMPWSTGMSPGVYDQVLESYSNAVDDARAQCLGFARQTADRLTESGYAAEAEVREGAAAEQIVAAAEAHGSDLVVMGTRGYTGLARVLFGSVARNVLTHAACSVLVVREKARIEPVVAHREEPATRISGG